MSTHIVHFYGPVTHVSLQNLRDVVLSGLLHQQSPASRFELRISSEGGYLTQGFTAYEFLRSLPVPVTTINLSNVESIAVLLYLAGEQRLCVPHGRFKLHALNWNFGAGTVDHDRMAEYTESLDIDADRYARIYDERTTAATDPIDVRVYLAGRAKFLDATAALQAGVVTTIDTAAIPPGAVHWWPNML